jgi:hypothetical protein
MNEPLRPLNLGEILDRTVNFYRSRFLVFFGISVIPTAVVLVIASGVFFFFAWMGSSGAATASPAMTGMVTVLFLAAAGLFALPLTLAATALASAAMNHAVNRSWQGEQITIRDAYKAVWKRGWRYIWLYLLQALIVWVAPLAAWVGLVSFSAGIAALSASAGMGAAAGALFGLLAVLIVAGLAGYCIWMLLRLCLAFPACVVEQIPAWDAVKRSSSLSKGTRGRVFVLYLLGTVLGWLLSGGLALVAAIVVALMPGMNTPQHAEATGMIVIFVYYGAAFAVQALTKPVYGIALILFYYDQRIRLEGFDIEWMMQQAGLVVPAPATAVTAGEAQPWLPADGRMVTEPQAQASAEGTTEASGASVDTFGETALPTDAETLEMAAEQPLHATSEESQ